jgi:photoactive yellow protein
MAGEQPPNLDPDARSSIHRVREVEALTRPQLDELPFGVIQVDRDGIVLAYNAIEARLADLDPAKVIGKNFFTEVAPCTNVEEFGQRFRDGIARGKLHDTFPFRFTFSKGPLHVMVTLHHEEGNDHAWIFVDIAPGA